MLWHKRLCFVSSIYILHIYFFSCLKQWAQTYFKATITDSVAMCFGVRPAAAGCTWIQFVIGALSKWGIKLIQIVMSAMHKSVDNKGKQSLGDFEKHAQY